MVSPMRSAYPAYVMLLYLIAFIAGEKDKLHISSLCNFLQSSVSKAQLKPQHPDIKHPHFSYSYTECEVFSLVKMSTLICIVTPFALVCTIVGTIVSERRAISFFRVKVRYCSWEVDILCRVRIMTVPEASGQSEVEE
jgi:hypothetical protein